MLDPQIPIAEQRRRFGFAWDDCKSFTPFMDFWSFYQELVRAAPPNSTIVEVGCYHGRSLVCLCLLAREANKGLKIVGVDDNTMGSSPALIENLKRAGLGDSVQFIEANSVVAARQFGDASCFSVFIDGGHLHEVVAADIRAWMPKVQPGGWLTGHDFLMYPVHQPVCALFGERLIYDQRWQDVWIVPKCEPDYSADIYRQHFPWPPEWKAWTP